MTKILHYIENYKFSIGQKSVTENKKGRPAERERLGISFGVSLFNEQAYPAFLELALGSRIRIIFSRSAIWSILNPAYFFRAASAKPIISAFRSGVNATFGMIILAFRF